MDVACGPGGLCCRIRNTNEGDGDSGKGWELGPRMNRKTLGRDRGEGPSEGLRGG